MKILVILTGGTIGSKVSQDTIDVSETSAYQLLYLYEKKYGTEIEFEVRQPLNCLSENLQMKDWELLLKELRKIDSPNYEGVIITHGSDTISYTSAFVGFACADTKIPIVLIASNYTLEDSRSNGLDNFRSAIVFIKSNKVKGIFTIFQDENKVNDIYLATRLVEADNYLDQFSSYGGVKFGRVEGEEVIFYNSALNPTIEEVNQPLECKIEKELIFTNQIMLIKPYIGLNYSYFEFKEENQPKAILHLLYHSATACVEGNNTSMLEFIKRCKSQGIDCYACSFKQASQCYDTSKQILEAGAIPLFYISDESAYVKLCLAYNQNKIPAQEFMKSNLYWEIIS